MISQENTKYALRNLAKRKLRSFLTIFSIFLGIAAVFIFVSFGFGLYDYVEEAAVMMGTDKIIIQARGVGAPGADTTFALTETDLSVLRRVRGIIGANGMYYTASQVRYRNEESFRFIIGFDPNSDIIDEFFFADIIEGRALRSGDVSNVVLGSNFRTDRIFDRRVNLGDRIEVNGQRFRVVGFYDSYGQPDDDGAVYMTEEAYLRFINPDATFAMIVGRVETQQDLDLIIERAERDLRRSRGLQEGREDFFIQTPEELIEQFRTVLNVIIGFVVLIALISVVVSAINTANTMITSVLERTQEIGIIKSIGGKNSEIFNIFLLESSLLGFLAGVIGVIVGYGVSVAIGSVLDGLGFGAIQPAFPWILFVGCIFFATLVGAVSGVAPAINASKQKPVDALRYE